MYWWEGEGDTACCIAKLCPARFTVQCIPVAIRRYVYKPIRGTIATLPPAHASPVPPSPTYSVMLKRGQAHALSHLLVHGFPSLSPPLRLPEAVAHEAARVFRDRLVEGAGESFNSLLAAVLNSMINFR